MSTRKYRKKFILVIFIIIYGHKIISNIDEIDPTLNSVKYTSKTQMKMDTPKNKTMAVVMGIGKIALVALIVVVVYDMVKAKRAESKSLKSSGAPSAPITTVNVTGTPESTAPAV